MACAIIGGLAGFSPSAVLTLSAYATEMGRSSVLAYLWCRGTSLSASICSTQTLVFAAIPG
jgi:hypothetical protein